MIKLEYQYEEHSPRIVVELHSDSSLDEVVEIFERFLLASGYSFRGRLGIVEDSESEGGEETYE